jgi:hypothetical protein
MVAFSQQAEYHVADTFDDEEETVTIAEAFAKVGALAVIVAEPSATPVTGTFTLVDPATNVTDKGTVETPGLLEFRLAVSPPGGAGPDRFKVRFCVAPPLIVKLPGEKLIAALVPPPLPEPTCTSALAGVKPYAAAVMIADPTPIPVTVGARLVTVAPAGMKIFAGATVTIEVSELLSMTKTPPDGAAVANVTWNGADWPGATVELVRRIAAGTDDPADAVIVKVAGVLLVKPLFTISCTT